MEMVPPPPKDSASQLQKGYRAVPISPDDASAPLRLCIVVRSAPDPVGGFFIPLRDLVDTTIYLGCVTDGGGYVHQWVELWLQNPNNLSNSLENFRGGLSNEVLDDRWKARVQSMEAVDRANLIRLPPTAQPLPLFFDISVTAPVNPKDKATSAPWELCTDDDLLQKHGLPPYRRSLARYLYLRENPGKFLPVTVGAPTSEATEDVQQALGSLMPFNPWCGHLMVRNFAPLSLEAHLDILGGVPWKGVEHGEKFFRPDGVYRTLQNADIVQRGDAHLFLSKRGKAAQLVETFYLKLDLLAQALRLVRDVTQVEQRPFLNLSAESFRVTLADVSPTLPFLWTARLVPAVPGSAIALPPPVTGPAYFLSPDLNSASIYRPEVAQRMVKGAATVTIWQVNSHDDGGISLKGTLVTHEQVEATPNDLLCIGLIFAPGRVDVMANFLDRAAGQTERHFVTQPQKFSEALGMALRSAEGVSFPNVEFETLPSVSSPCDLYSLGVLGIRALLVNETYALPVALNDFFTLAQACVDEAQTGTDLRERIRATTSSDARWVAALGPQRVLAPNAISVEDATASLPLDVWWDAMAILIRCFSGKTPDALRADPGDAPPGALESVFQPVIDDLDQLLATVRSVLFLDARSASELNAFAQAALDQLRDSGE
jgi:hypothetical protein